MQDIIIGHRKILNYFEKVIAAGNLSHAYCFVGPARVGKRTLAEKLGAELLNVEPEKLAAQADFMIIGPAIDEKTGKTKKDISIEQLRDCQSFFFEYSFLGGYKIVIIDPADKMSLAAANALLKILEEPRQKTLFFLLVTDEGKLPPTIRSRCQMVYFSPAPSAEIERALAKRGTPAAAEIARLARGLPGQAIAWAEDQESYEAYKNEAVRFGSLTRMPFCDKIKKVEDLFGDKKDHIAAREKLGETLDIWLTQIRESLLESPGGKESAERMAICDLIQTAKKNLEKNIHPRLLVEQILLSLA